MTVQLSLAIAESPLTRHLLSGNVPIEGVTPEFLSIKPQIAAYRKMVRDLAFDVCELAPTTYLIAKAHGCPITALPVFLMRRFHHAGLKIHPDAGISHPKDLQGKKVGVRAYSVTSGVWARAILTNEYGLDASKVTWVVDDEEHVRELALPANVAHVEKGRSLFDMFTRGELAAGLDGNAGIGRSGDPFNGWRQEDVSQFPELFPNASQLEREWYERTGIYPIHGTLVVKQAILDDNPWLAEALVEAFISAKHLWLDDLEKGLSDPMTNRYRKLADIVGKDPLPFGIPQNLPTIKALHEAALNQNLIQRALSMAEMFTDPRI